MELSNDWFRRTNLRLADILSDTLKELKPPKVSSSPKPTHGYTIAEKEPEVVTAPGVYFPAKKGEVIPLKPRKDGGTVTPTPTRTLREMVEKLTSITPRQNGGEVDPNLFKNTFSVNSGDSTQQGIEAAANTASLNYTPLSPAPSLQSFAPGGEANPTPAAPSTPPVTGAPAANSTNSRLNQITGFLRSFMKPPPAFKENRHSPIFGSDQRAAYDKKWKPYTDFMEGTKETPLFPRDRGGTTSPDPLEGLSEEERKRRVALLKTELPTTQTPGITDLTKPVDLSSQFSADEPLKYQTDGKDRSALDVSTGSKPVVNEEEMALNAPTGSLSDIGKEILPSGETRYTLPGTEGTATVGPERFFLKNKEVPAGTPGAVSGDEMARKRILREAAPPKLTLPERTYYDAHPEERFMDRAREENKPLMDAYNKLIEENRTRSQGFGMIGVEPKAARVIQAEATRAVPELTKGLEQMMAVNQAVPEKYFSSEARAGKTGTPHWTQDAKTGEVVAIYPPGATGGKPTIVPTGVIAGGAAEKSPTELGLIAKAGERGPDGKLTPEAVTAQRILDDEKKRKLDIQGGGVPTLTTMPPHPPGQKYNDAALEGIDPGVAATIKKVVNYEIQLPSGFALKSPYWQNVISRASLYDPSFDAMQYPVKFGVRKSFTSGKDKDNIVGLNTVVGHINSLVKAKNELANSNWQMGNQAVNILAKYFPVSEGLVKRQGTVTGIKTKFNAVKDEMASIFKKNGATDIAIKSWSDTLSDPATATPESWNAFINGSLELMGSRIEALRNTYERGIGAPKDFTFLSDKSRTILKNLGVDVNAIDPVAGSEAGATPAEKKPSAADFGGNPEPKAGTVSREQWVSMAKGLNPGISDAVLGAEYDRKYGGK